MKIDGGAICAGCGHVRPFDALLVVTSHVTGRRRFVCRPSFGAYMPMTCFRDVAGPAAIDAIALAQQPRTEHIAEHAVGRGADLRQYRSTAVAS